jgi:malonyl-CoA O-methyltransferase
MIDKDLIKRNFSEYAKYYDRYASVQNACALKLVQKINTPGPENILEIGCGTGNYTWLLRRRYPDSEITAVDISDEMIRIAKTKLVRDNIEFITADAEEIRFNRKFDLITSNASFQWFDDLQGSLERYKNILARGGSIVFSIFGPRTFGELGICMGKYNGKNFSISSTDFIEKKRIEDILRAISPEPVVEEEIIKENHSSVFELLKKIKYTGTRGNGMNGNKMWTRRTINEIEDIYIREFGEIVSTSQVFFCTA